MGFAFRETFSHNLDWTLLGAGGGQAVSGSINLNASLGQSVIGSSTSDSGSVTLWAGYWIPGSRNMYRLYLPLVFKNP